VPFADGLALLLIVFTGGCYGFAWLCRAIERHCDAPKVPDVAAPTRPAPAVPKRPEA